ncbi:SDR family oxidoreductase [Solimonas sp. K1W22B-7]|uniref:SDR family oxidoreductase n=1 Tax=Solimonas sp. K1W22B-7 TaxID=2303331 RepID=UPI000E32E2F2|nr:SDR family oxidoreductase [Solimonas sp. K1W22B-7]AXQ30574.1 SDR family oxidoreductase [Solimonas sp. K1W22B-7]
MSYQGKVVFVAGGTSGINLGMAEAFAACGARVGVLSRSEKKVESAVAALNVHGSGAMGFASDVRDYEAVASALSRTVDTWGPIDVLISGAAGNFLSLASQLSPNAFKAVIDIDLLGTFNVLRAAYQHLRKPGAVVLNVTAPQAWIPTAFQVHACAAKAGVDQVTRTCALEWGPEGVRVNAIAPGPIADTEGMRRLAPDPAIANALIASVPCRRYGRVDEIARVALWLCSSDASYITGVVLPVDGGWSLAGSAGLTQAVVTAGGVG